MPKFRGPGPADDFCPIASLYALKALNQDEETRKSEAAHFAKYPMSWYNLLHVRAQ
ncbi:MAG: hypothetical protein ACLFST_09415 [Spirochaetia bacterium]